MSGRLAAVIGNFATHPDLAERALEDIADRTVQLGNREHAWLGSGHDHRGWIGRRRGSGFFLLGIRLRPTKQEIKLHCSALPERAANRRRLRSLSAVS